MSFAMLPRVDLVNRAGILRSTAGLTLLELLITVGMLLVASSLATVAVNWIGNLLRLPNPDPAINSVRILRDIYNSTSITSAQDCGLTISTANAVNGGPDVNINYVPRGAIACYRYTDNALKIYGHRAPGSCDISARSAVDSVQQSVRLDGLRRCEYEEQTAVKHLYP